MEQYRNQLDDGQYETSGWRRGMVKSLNALILRDANWVDEWRKMHRNVTEGMQLFGCNADWFEWIRLWSSIFARADQCRIKGRQMGDLTRVSVNKKAVLNTINEGCIHSL
jgi:hypothetical protein